MQKPKKKNRAQKAKDQVIKGLLEVGAINQKNRNVEKAEEAYRAIIEIDPLNFNGLYMLGVLHAECGRNQNAVEFLEMCLKVNPKHSLAYNDLGVVYHQLGDVKNATENFQKALQLNEKFAEAQNNLGVMYQGRGDHKKAKEHYERAKNLNPFYFDACNNYIFSLDLSEEETIETLVQARKEWAEVHETPLLKEHKPHTNDLSLNRKLRIGYVSADFRLHSASFIFGGMLAHYNKDKFEVYAYNNWNGIPDTRMIAFKNNVDNWKDVYGISDEEFAEIIRNDKIDILVDLSSYSAGSRLLTFARKPAPIQVTAWGYTTSTGLKSMDYFFADDVIVPSEEKHFYEEEVIHLPNCANHYCPEKKPEIQEPPCIKNGYITFGSFNRLTKISDTALRAWTAIMNQVPDSKILFKINTADFAPSQERIIRIFSEEGIDQSRIIFKGSTPWYEHIDHFNQVDVMLDSFPHSGGLTSIESIMQGTPIITLTWPTIVGRVATTILQEVGMYDWITDKVDDYIKVAIEKANNIEELKTIKNTLPSKYKNSIIGDSETYCEIIENTYLQLWEKYIDDLSSLQ